MPDFSLEKTLGKRVAGLDEVGRGPWAGPVMAAAVVIDPAQADPDLIAALDDSKALSAAKRRALDAALRVDPGVTLAVAAASVAEIEALNIAGATFLAMTRALEALPCPVDAALVDGNRLPPALPCPARAVVGGDRLSASIAAASILAKVARDQDMARLADLFPGYGWERNAGYGTAEHRAALARLGVTPHHRRGYKPVRAALALTEDPVVPQDLGHNIGDSESAEAATRDGCIAGPCLES